MSGYNIGLTGLQSAQTAMDAVSQNIANASTPDYKKLDTLFKAVDFSGTDNKPFLPGGVNATTKTASDPFADNRVAAALGVASYNSAYNDGLKLLNDSVVTSTAEQTFSSFMNASQDLNVNPNDPTRQTAFKNAGQAFSTAMKGLGDQFSSVTQQLTNLRDLKQIQINSLQAQMAEITKGPVSDQSKAALDSMTKQVMMLTNSISGYNQVINGVIPPITTMYDTAQSAVVTGANTSYGQNILDTNGGFTFDASNIGNVKALTEFGSQQFNKDMGVINTEMGSKLTASNTTTDASTAALDVAQKSLALTTGVNLEQQTVDMLKFQRMYEANAKVIQTQDNMMGALLSIKA